MRTRSWTVELVLFDEVELVDVAGAVQALTLAGRQWNWRPFKIVPVAAARGSVATRNQLRLEASEDFVSCPATEIVLVPGGYGARAAADDERTVAHVRERAAAATLCTAVGQGVLLLARAGVIGDAEVALSRELAPALLEIAPAARVDTRRRVVESGRLLTAPGGTTSIDLGLSIVARLCGKKQALGVAQELRYELPEQEQLRVDILPPKL